MSRHVLWIKFLNAAYVAFNLPFLGWTSHHTQYELKILSVD